MRGNGIVDYSAIGKRVRQKREQNRLTQEKLAEMVEVSVSFIGHVERAEKIPSVETIVKMAAALEVSMDELVLGVQVRCDREKCPLYGELGAALRACGIEVGREELRE